MNNAKKTIAVEKGQSRRSQKSTPKPACPGCGMIKNDWPGEGYTHDGETYCCQGCAEGTGCMCVAVGKTGFSRQGQKLTWAEPRPGEQRAGAPAPRGELSGERDNLGTEEAQGRHYNNSWIRRFACSGETPSLRKPSGPSPVCNTGSSSSRLCRSVRRQNNPIGISSPH